MQVLQLAATKLFYICSRLKRILAGTTQLAATKLTGRVHAYVVAPPVVPLALVLVNAGGGAAGLHEAHVAHALVRAKHVLADAVGANAAGKAAFVNILR